MFLFATVGIPFLLALSCGLFLPKRRTALVICAISGAVVWGYFTFLAYARNTGRDSEWWVAVIAVTWAIGVMMLVTALCHRVRWGRASGEPEATESALEPPPGL